MVRVAFPGRVSSPAPGSPRSEPTTCRIHRTLPPAKLAEIEEALALTDRIVSAEDAGHDEALSALAAIRQSLRQGTMTTRQIKRA